MVIILVKLLCDRCKQEIEEKYYIVNFYEQELYPKHESACDYATATYYSSHTRESALQILNAKKMYCSKCKNEIEKFIAYEEV